MSLMLFLARFMFSSSGVLKGPLTDLSLFWEMSRLLRMGKSHN